MRFRPPNPLGGQSNPSIIPSLLIEKLSGYDVIIDSMPDPADKVFRIKVRDRHWPLIQRKPMSWT
jgi:hypothetical protein